MIQLWREWTRYVDTLAMSICALSLLKRGLVRRHPLLFAALTLQGLSSWLSYFFAIDSGHYLAFFVTDSVAEWVLWTLLIAVLARNSLRPFPALAWVSRRTLATAVGIAVGVALLAEPLLSTHYVFSSRILPLVLRFDQLFTAAIAIFLLLLCALLAWFRVPLARNTQRLCLGLGVLFSCRSTVYFLAVVLGPSVVPLLNLLMFWCSAAVFLGLAWTLRKDGETATAFIGPRPSPEVLHARVQLLGEFSKSAAEVTRR